jgi:chromatin segregation and condensation protein Rec8/ScpA/Scc1 (kleisin family)
MDVHVLSKALERILLRMGERKQTEDEKPIDRINPIIKRPIVPVSEKIVSVLRFMYRRGTAHFDELFENAKSRSEIVALFYATLELLKAGRLSMMKAVGDATNSNIILEFNRKHKRDEAAENSAT